MRAIMKDACQEGGKGPSLLLSAFFPSFNLALHTPFMQATMQISVTNGIVKEAKHRLKVAQAFKSNLYRDQTKIKKEYSECVGCVRQAPFSNV